MNIGEIAASTAGDENFLSGPFRPFEDGDSPSPLAGFDRTHQTGGASAEYDDVGFKHTPSRCEFSQTLPGERVVMRQTPPPSLKGVFWGYVFYFVWHVAGYCL